MAFQKIKAIREGKNDQSENFEMKILDEGALDKAMPVPQETPDGNNPVRQFMRLLTMDNLNS